MENTNNYPVPEDMGWTHRQLEDPIWLAEERAEQEKDIARLVGPLPK